MIYQLSLIRMFTVIIPLLDTEEEHKDREKER